MESVEISEPALVPEFVSPDDTALSVPFAVQLEE